MPDTHQLASPVDFLHLTVDQLSRHLPPKHLPPSPKHLEPLSKMSRECIKVEIESITGKEWDAPRRQALLESMDEPMGHGLGARAEVKRRKNLGERIDRQPDPENLMGAAEPGAQFVQLQMWEPQIGEGTLMQGLGVLTCAREPGDDGTLSK